MSSTETVSSWFEPVPMDEYAQLVKDSGFNVPDECPISETIGSPALDVRCGPYLRLLATFEDGVSNYRATLMIVTHDPTSDYSSPPELHYVIGPSKDSSIESDLQASMKQGTFPVTRIHQEQDHTFWRFDIELMLASYEQKVKYILNNYTNANFQFYIPAIEQSMNIVSHSCNGFSLSTDTSTYKGSMWFDVMKKHEQHPYHVMLGGGDQLYADGIKNSSQEFQKWLKHKHIHSTDPLTKELVASFEDFYLHQYLKWFGKGYWVGSNGKTLQPLFPIAMQQIPSINMFDDHDIIDGFGSYDDRTMGQDVFKGVGNSAFKYYMLFQHHTSMQEKLFNEEKSWILGSRPGPFMKEKSHSIYCRLGKEIGFTAFDCRTERRKTEVIRKDSYKIIFDRMQKEVDNSNGEIKHMLILLGVPIAYPRLVWLEYLLTSRIFAPLKYLARKGIILQGLVNEFDGNIEVLDDLDDHWCAKHHKRERNYLLSKLTDFGATNGVRITILSGDVHLCCIGRLKSKRHQFHKKEETEFVQEHPEKDPRLIFNVISSAICNAPPPNGMSKLLHWRNKVHNFDRLTMEDTVPLFTKDVDGTERDSYHFLNRRNWCDLIPMKESTRYLNNPDFEVGEKILPGPLDSSKGESKDDTFDKYPINPDSMVVTLHVEKDSQNVASETADYELLIPALLTTEKLNHEGIKL